MRLLSNVEIDNHYREWRIGGGSNFHDFIWSLFNFAIIQNGENLTEESIEIFYRNSASLYYSMAHFRREEGANGKTINKFMRLGFEAQAQEYIARDLNSRLSYDVVVLSPSKGFCSYADSVNGHQYHIEDFIEQCHIATDKCTDIKYGFCRCCISVICRKDKNGRLVRKN